MTKNEVDNERVKSFVFMPESVETSISLWWANLPNDRTVSVRYPHEKRGFAGKVSNSVKVSTKELFLKFVDNNLQANGGDWIPETPPTIFSLSLRQSLSPNAMQVLTMKRLCHLLCTSLIGHKGKQA